MIASEFARPNVQHDLLYDGERYDHINKECNVSTIRYRQIDRSRASPFGESLWSDRVWRPGNRTWCYTRERLGKEFDVLCFEMEAAGMIPCPRDVRLR
jgi:hypothetical protein